jgi:hypothetical protein
MKVNLKIVLAGIATAFTLTQAHAMRWYSPNTAHWLSRDPIGERGGANLYGFVANDPVGKFDVLGQYPGVYTYSLAEMQAMLRQSKQDFSRRLKALCPISSSTGWTDSDGRKQCCSPEACRVQAEAMTLEFARYLEVNFTTEYMRFGNVIAFTPLWIPGETINDRADKAPNQGMIWVDYDKGYGLKCYGWQDLIRRRFQAFTMPLRRDGRQCFKGAEVGNNRDQNKASHHWFGIYGPFNDDVNEVDVDVDPWFSAGGIISPVFPFARAGYHNPILW